MVPGARREGLKKDTIYDASTGRASIRAGPIFHSDSLLLHASIARRDGA